jgi:hypothetical protein
MKSPKTIAMIASADSDVVVVGTDRWAMPLITGARTSATMLYIVLDIRMGGLDRRDTKMMS